MPKRLPPALLALTIGLAFLVSPQAHAATTTTSKAPPKMGASTPDNASFEALNKVAGPLAARRTYNGSVPRAFSSSGAASDVAAGRTSYWSFKPNAKTFASDTAAQSAFSSFLNSIPSGHQTVVVALHEPEDNIRGGDYTLAQWGATNNKVGQIIRSKKRPELRHAICLMGPWTFDSRGPYYSYKWESVLDFNLVDVVGIDPYKFRTSDSSLEQQLTVANSGTGGSNPSTMQKLASWGKPVALMEWGVVTKDVKSGAGISDSARGTWISDAYTWMKEWNGGSSVKIEAAMYFNLNVSSGNSYLTGLALAAFTTAARASRQ